MWISLCSIHNTARESSANLPVYPSGSRPCSDVMYWRERLKILTRFLGQAYYPRGSRPIPYTSNQVIRIFHFRDRNSRMARKARRMSIGSLDHGSVHYLSRAHKADQVHPPPCNSSLATHSYPNIVCALPPLTYRQQTHNMLSTERETCSFWF